MEIYIISFIVIAVMVSGMAVGVIFSNKELKGSCGGLNKVIGEDCYFCDKKDECTENPEVAKECLDLA